MKLAKTIYEQVNSTLLTWQEASVSRKLVRLVSGYVRPPRSTSLCRHWETSSLPWLMDAPNTYPIETPSWRGYCRTLWEEIHAPWWSPVSPLQITTMRKAWALCAMQTGLKASRIDPESMRTPRTLCSESIKKRSRSCGHSCQASRALLTFQVNERSVFCD